MFEWNENRSGLSLASSAEREVILSKLHPVFREVDAGFHAYLEVITSNPAWDDGQIDKELVRRGVEPGLAGECVVFSPLAWGREITEQLGVSCSPLFWLHNITDGTERELPLANEMTYAWARAMIGPYRTEARNGLFKLVSTRSAEVQVISDALYKGVSEVDLRGSNLAPVVVWFRRAPAGGA